MSIIELSVSMGVEGNSFSNVIMRQWYWACDDKSKRLKSCIIVGRSLHSHFAFSKFPGATMDNECCCCKVFAAKYFFGGRSGEARYLINIKGPISKFRSQGCG